MVVEELHLGVCPCPSITMMYARGTMVRATVTTTTSTTARLLEAATFLGWILAWGWTSQALYTVSFRFV